MAVYKRGYQRYEGGLTGRWARFLALPRFAWARLLDEKMIWGALLTGAIAPLGYGAFAYVANHSELWSGLAPNFAQILKVDGLFFLTFMNSQAAMAVILAALAGPGLISPDLANNALPLYFSRPQSRADYVLARLVTLLGLLAMITIVPGMLLIALQTGLAGFGWLQANWQIAVAVPVGFLAWITLASLVALASSAYVKWRVVAGALVLGFFFVLAGAGELVNEIFPNGARTGTRWGSLINPTLLMERVWADMLAVDTSEALPELLPSLLMLGLLTAALVLILERKLRPVEVVK